MGYETGFRRPGWDQLPESVRERFWAAVRSGLSPTEAAVVAGVSEHRGRQWVEQAGYVPRTVLPAGPEPESPSRPRAMTFVERCRLEELLEAGYCKAKAADLLKRDRSTIYREVDRGSTDSGYRAWTAQQVVDANRARPKARKLESNPVLLAEVLQRLEQRHSPEQIAGRLPEDFPDDPEMWVSHETIYQAMYVQPRGELALNTVQLRRANGEVG
ncbi:MAG: transposase [Mycobacterium sp.]